MVSEICMNKKIHIAILIALSLLLVACGKSEAVKNTESLISELDSISSTDDESKVIEAEEAYDRLTDKEKELVENKDDLITARETIDELKAEEEAAVNAIFEEYGLSSLLQEASVGARNGAKKAIEITDAYINYDISSQEADKQLLEILNRLDDNGSVDDSSIRVNITLIEAIIAYSDVTSTGRTDDIIEYRNKLAEIIGEEPYK